jgi:hypothetical protein
MSDLEEISELMDTVGSNADSEVKPSSTYDDSCTEVVAKDTGVASNSNPSRWARSGKTHWGVQDSTPSLECGMYTGGRSDAVGYYLTKVTNATDGLIHLPDSASDSVLREIDEFADLKPEFVSRKMIYKRGIFLWGPPGSGKTSTLAQLVDIVINKMQGIAFVVEHPETAAGCLKLIRQIEPNRQIVALLEDMDALIESYGEARFLSILDGENQVDNIIFVATTNYPERMDKRFIDRPSRFDSVIKVGMPSAKARSIYLAAKEPGLTPEQIEQYVKLSEGFSIAHLREFIILTRVFKRDIEWAAKKLRAMMGKPPSSSSSDGAEFGFTSSKSEGDKQVAEMPVKASRSFRP